MHLTEWPGIEAGDLLQHLGPAVRAKRPSACQQFIQDHSHAENVGAAVHQVPFAACLFRAHVVGRTHDACLFAEILIPQRQTKVRQMRATGCIDQDVGRLDVAMHQTAIVGVL
jgi:hypothetical protein